MKDNGFRVKAIFIEVDYPNQTKFIKIVNKLRNILNFPQFGYYGEGFISLENLLSQEHCPMVFFEKLL